jgi:hypothetical protein
MMLASRISASRIVPTRRGEAGKIGVNFFNGNDDDEHAQPFPIAYSGPCSLGESSWANRRSQFGRRLSLKRFTNRQVCRVFRRARIQGSTPRDTRRQLLRRRTRNAQRRVTRRSRDPFGYRIATGNASSRTSASSPVTSSHVMSCARRNSLSVSSGNQLNSPVDVPHRIAGDIGVPSAVTNPR